MGTFIQIRGTNGSGKSTLARALMAGSDGKVGTISIPVLRYTTEKGRERIVPATLGWRCAILGDYSTMAGGLDKVPTFALQQEAVAAALEQFNVVVAEGVLASTVYGSWATFAHALHDGGHRTIWAYLQTPIETCLARIRQRNGGKPIKEEQVRDKVRAIAATRRKVRVEDNIATPLLPLGAEKEFLNQLIAAEADRWSKP